jgi:hypothetical protein
MNSAGFIVLGVAILILVLRALPTILANRGGAAAHRASPSTVVRSYIGDREMERGITQMARRGYAVQSHTTNLIGRGATKFAIGYLAAQKTRHTVVFVRSV